MKTNRLEIEALKEEHAIHLFPIMQDKKLFEFVDEEVISDKEQLEERYRFLAMGAPEDNNETWLNWVVKLNDQDRYIGTLQATIYEDAYAEIAYMFSPTFWGQGYGTEATRKLCDFLFETFRISKIIASVDVNNHASIKLLERLEFLHFETVNCNLKGKPAQEHHYYLSNN